MRALAMLDVQEAVTSDERQETQKLVTEVLENGLPYFEDRCDEINAKAVVDALLARFEIHSKPRKE